MKSNLKDIVPIDIINMNDLQKLRQKNLETIFHPKSVAVIGTNKVKGTVPHDILIAFLNLNSMGLFIPLVPVKKV